MAAIDPADDSRRRFIVWHYAYDPERRQRRNQEVIAFDDPLEFEAYVEQANRELKIRQDDGEADPREHLGGTIKYAGDDARKTARTELEWKLRGGAATDADIAQASSLGFAIARRIEDDEA